MSGACVRRARLQAADGMPMPTKQTSLLLRARAAAIVIISVGVWVSGMMLSLNRGEPPALGREGVRALVEHVCLHPGEEAVAVARDRVPLLVIGIVALVVALRIGGIRAARNADHCGHGPGRQDHRIEVAV